MAKFKVIKSFTDLTDDNYVYVTGDDYPRDGVSVDEDRVKELSGKGNKQGTPLIVSTEPQKKPSRKGRKTSAR